MVKRDEGAPIEEPLSESSPALPDRLLKSIGLKNPEKKLVESTPVIVKSEAVCEVEKSAAATVKVGSEVSPKPVISMAEAALLNPAKARIIRFNFLEIIIIIFLVLFYYWVVK